LSNFIVYRISHDEKTRFQRREGAGGGWWKNWLRRSAESAILTNVAMHGQHKLNNASKSCCQHCWQISYHV
jgi:hypothetical protein